MQAGFSLHMFIMCPPGLEAMEAALELEKKVNQSLLDLHKVADTHGDFQVTKNILVFPSVISTTKLLIMES